MGGRRRAIGLLVALASCRFDFDYAGHDGNPSGPDGGVAAGDASVTDGLTAPVSPFGPAQEIDELSTFAGEDDPTLTADLLEIYFNSDITGNVEIWRASRMTPAERFGLPDLVNELSSGAIDSTPEISPDGSTIFISRSNFGGTVDVLVSTRETRSSTWTTPQPVADLNSAWNDAGSAPTADRGRIFFFSDRAGTFDLFEARLAGLVSGGWSPPEALDELSSSAYDSDPCPALDGNLLVFASNRDAGDFDLYVATRPSLDVPFGPPLPLDELNTQAEERDPWISPDGRVIYFESFRSGTPHIYEARR